MDASKTNPDAEAAATVASSSGGVSVCLESVGPRDRRLNFLERVGIVLMDLGNILDDRESVKDRVLSCVIGIPGLLAAVGIFFAAIIMLIGHFLSDANADHAGLGEKFFLVLLGLVLGAIGGAIGGIVAGVVLLFLMGVLVVLVCVFLFSLGWILEKIGSLVG